MTPETPPREAAQLREEDSVLEIHRALLRETPDPKEGREKIPAWMFVFIAAVIFVSGFYLGHNVEDAVSTPTRANAMATAKTAKPAVISIATRGAGVFAAKCAGCHQQTGTGVPGAFPPLAGSEWLAGAADTPIKIVLRGLSGPVTVAGSAYNGMMPAWASILSDDEIAAVLTYVRSSWGNHASEVSASDVAALRTSTASRTAPWTAAELRP